MKPADVKSAMWYSAMTRAGIGVALGACLLAGFSTATAAPLWRERYLAAAAACRRGDAAAGRDSMTALAALLPGHQGRQIAIARASTRLGDVRGAVRAFEEFADMGIAADPAQDTTFRSLAADSGYQSVLKRFERNRQPRVAAKLAHRLADRDLLAEDIAYDSRTRRWFVSAVHGRKIVAIDASGHETEFAPGHGERPWGVFALGVDVARRRLWAGTAATPEMEAGTGANAGRSMLMCYDLDRGAVLRRFEPPDSGSHVLGDLTVADDGTVYVSDSRGGGVYVVRPGADSLAPLVPPGNLVSPQTPALVRGGRLLIVPDYSRGLAAVDLMSGSLSWLEQPADLAAAGIDGLYAWRGNLIAIQNGTEPRRLLWLELDSEKRAIRSWRVLEQASPELGEPNHGALVGDTLTLIGNSGWDRMSDEGVMSTPAEARAPALLRLDLKRAR